MQLIGIVKIKNTLCCELVEVSYVGAGGGGGGIYTACLLAAGAVGPIFV